MSFLLLSGLAFEANSEAKFTHIETGSAWVYSVVSDFEDVKDSLVEAIESRGMVISYVSHAESMLARTAQTVGAQAVYSDALVLLFCKANLAHRLVAVNPHHLVLCPYALSVYSLVGERSRIYIGMRAPQTGIAEYRAIHQMQVEVISEALADQ